MRECVYSASVVRSLPLSTLSLLTLCSLPIDSAVETPMSKMARAVAAAAQARRDAGVPLLSDDLHEMRTAPLNEAEERVVYDVSGV